MISSRINALQRWSGKSLLRSADFSTFLIKNVPISGLNKTNEAPSVRKSGRELLLPALSYNELSRQTTRRSHDGLKFGFRMLVKRPGFTAVAIITLALGIGATTTIFSVVNGVLLSPLPYPQPDRLMILSETSRDFQ